MVPTAIRHPSEMSAETLQAHRLIRAMPSECSWSSTTAGTYTRYDIPRVQETILMPGKVGAWVLKEDELRRTLLPRLYEKSSNSGESPRHEANHGSVHQRFAARTKPLVVFAHPPLLVDPR